MSNFRSRFHSGDALFGSFLKVQSTMPAEILGSVGFDFVVVDEEHSPFNRETTDRIVLACRAWGIGVLVRVRSADPAAILSVLDCGADGVLVPHVTDAATASGIVGAAKYRDGQRGFAPTTRAGDFGARNMADHVDTEDARTLVIAMIEDPEAVRNIDDIVAVEGLDGVFIGRGDLAAAYLGGENADDLVARATDRVQAAAHGADKTVAVLPTSTQDAAARARAGAKVFVLSSDQGFLRSAAMGAFANMSAAVTEAMGDGRNV